jgi:hypothetical protein
MQTLANVGILAGAVQVYIEQVKYVIMAQWAETCKNLWMHNVSIFLIVVTEQDKEISM